MDLHLNAEQANIQSAITAEGTLFLMGGDSKRSVRLKNWREKAS
jgi:hypothetical protein